MFSITSLHAFLLFKEDAVAVDDAVYFEAK